MGSPGLGRASGLGYSRRTMPQTPSITLYHHPFSRASSVVWMLEELGLPYELKFVDFQKAEHKGAEVLERSPMGKLPMLIDGDTVVTETAAIGLYLADRYSYGELAPKVDDPARGTYLRWSLFAPSVIEPGCMAKMAGWDVKTSTAGWGKYEDILATIEHAIGDGPWLLGDRFTMADIIFGGTVRFMLQFKMLEPRPALVAYAGRLAERPPSSKADAKNAEVVEERGLAT